MPCIANSLKAQNFKGKSVGNGQCVAFVHGAVNIPPASLWHRGVPVKGDLSLPIGTVIATFDASGLYGNHTDGTSHAAVYMGQNGLGIQVLDQWDHHGVAHPVHERTIGFHNGPGRKVDEGNPYHVVE